MAKTRKLADLRSHPENSLIFGDPEESEAFDVLVISIRKFGICEPLIIKADGTILAGHLRRAVAKKLGLKEVPVRVHEPFGDYREEVEFVIRQNTDRRHLRKSEIALAFKRLRELPKEQGGTKRKPGPKPNRTGCPILSASRQDSRADTEAAEALGVNRNEARALETVFTTPGVSP